jgi:transcription factor TFIIIB component B''
VTPVVPSVIPSGGLQNSASLVTPEAESSAAAAAAAVIVDSIRSLPPAKSASQKKKRAAPYSSERWKRKREKTKKEAEAAIHTLAEGPAASEAGAAESSMNGAVEAPPGKQKRGRRPRRRLRGDESLDDELIDPDSENEEEEAARLARKRGPYASRGRAGTDRDLRLKENRHKSKHAERALNVSKAREIGPPSTFPELLEAQPGQMIGVAVDPGVMTLKDLVTVSMSEGKTSARGIRLSQSNKADSERKKLEKIDRDWDTWMRKQVIRRKLRASKNAERAERRLRELVDGTVSDDSPDSAEDFHMDPDRLTPTSSPEPPSGRYLNGNNEDLEDGMEVDAELNDGNEETEQGILLGELPEHRTLDDEEREHALLQASYRVVDDEGEVRLDAHDDDVGPLRIVDEEDDGIGSWRARRDDARSGRLAQINNREVEEEDESTAMVNSNTFAKQRVGARWTEEDTEMFYMVGLILSFITTSLTDQALREVGENFALMKAFFPGRSVAELKRKGVRENKSKPQRVTEAILNRQRIGQYYRNAFKQPLIYCPDQQYLVKAAGYDADRPFDREEALFAEARDDVERLRQIVDTAYDEEDGGDGMPEQETMPNGHAAAVSYDYNEEGYGDVGGNGDEGDE